MHGEKNCSVSLECLLICVLQCLKRKHKHITIVRLKTVLYYYHVKILCEYNVKNLPKSKIYMFELERRPSSLAGHSMGRGGFGGG